MTPFPSGSYAARRFEAIVAHARQVNPFYRDWLSGGPSVPVLDRLTVLENNDLILNGVAPTGETSGSTGVPVRYAFSPEYARQADHDTNRFVEWLGGPRRSVAIVFPYRDDPGSDVLSVHSTPAEQLDFLDRRHHAVGAIALTTYPSNAQLLLHYMLDRGEVRPEYKRVGLMSEAVDETLRAMIAQSFPDATIWETYSSREFGMIAGGCPHQPGYFHYMAHRLGIEIIRDDGTACDQGEVGRVVITGFMNDVFPLIRYEIGDRAAFCACPCGRIRLPALCRLEGKVRGALLHRNGRRVAFVELSAAMRAMKDMRQFQVLQHSVEHFTVRLVGPASLERPVTDAFARHFGYVPRRPEFSFEPQIDREHNGKLHESICYC